MRTSSTSDKIEWGLLAFCLISVALRLLSGSIFDSVFVFAAFSLILYYCLRMYLGFKSWKVEKGLAIASSALFLGVIGLLVSWTILMLFRPGSDGLLEIMLMISFLICLSAALYFGLIRKGLQPVYRQAWLKGHLTRWGIILPLMLLTYLIGWQSLFHTFYPEHYNLPQAFTTHHPNGAKHIEGFYLNGLPDSTWVYYDQMGDTVKVQDWQD